MILKEQAIKEILPLVREYFQIPDYVSDEIVYDVTKDTYGYAVINIKFQFNKLIKSIIKSFSL